MLGFGGPVPITYGNNFHIGNDDPRPGADLIPDLMNGVVFYYAQRYQISPLDLAMLADSGLPVTAIPEPGAPWIMAAGLALLAAHRQKRTHGADSVGLG